MQRQSRAGKHCLACAHRKNSFPHMHKSIHSRSMKKRDPSPRGSESERSDGGTDWPAQAPDSRKLSTLEIESDTGQKEVPGASTSNVDNLPRTFPSSSHDLAPHSDIHSRRGTTKSHQPPTATTLVAGVHPTHPSSCPHRGQFHSGMGFSHRNRQQQKVKLARRHQQEDEATRPTLARGYSTQWKEN
uniref:Uncharacterized protein n=1 Tax=Timema monikensis TaxID=170555 RepID=A0A7R9HUC3_9NEOP|nr:unnamed protein product [Timema monikensis]